MAVKFAQCSLLIVEPEWVISNVLAQEAIDRGCSDVVNLCSAAKALEWLEQNSPVLAILDFAPSALWMQLISTLRERGSLVIIYSGFDSSLAFGSPAEGLPWVEKPDTTQMLWKLASPHLSDGQSVN